MRKTAIALATLGIIASIASFTMWQELHAERDMSADLRAQLADRTNQLRSLKSVHASVPLASVTAADSSTGAASAPAKSDLTGENCTPRSVQSTSGGPEFRRAMAAQRRVSLPQGYPDLVNELHLSPEEANRLFDLIAKQDSDPILSIRDGVERSRAVTAQRENRKAELVALLGSRYSQFEEYKKTQPTHLETAQLRRGLEATGEPLRDDQARSLNAMAIAERLRLDQEKLDLARRSSTQESQSPAQYQEAAINLKSQSNERLLEAARSQLSASQVQTYRAMLEAQIASSRASLHSQAASTESN